MLRALLGVSYHGGGPFAWEVLRGGRSKILMFHGVPERARFPGIENWYGYNIPAASFGSQLAYLKRNCNVVSLSDLRAGRNLAARRTNVVLTFDDGYENNYTQAFPLLQRHRLPATFALPTGFVLRREPLYNDMAEYAVQHTQKRHVRLALGGAPREFAPIDQGGRLELFNELMRECVRMEQERRAAFLAEVCAALEVRASAAAMFDNQDYRPLTPGQVREMAGCELVELASHSVHHYLLSRASRETKRAELRDSKREIEALTGRPCTAFCVPGGVWDRELLDEAFAAGYECVLTSDVGNAAPGQRVLNRNGVFHEPDLWWFADMVRGPVQKLVGEARRAVRRVRSPFRAG